MDWQLEVVVLPVSDVDRAKAFYGDQVGFRVDVDHRAGELFHVGAGGQEPGPDPERRDFGTFLSFADPDGNGWLVQEVRSRGRR